MYKNQLQELAQRSCFNLPSYTCIREGPDHAPRFKATVNFNGEIFESPQYCSTLRQAEHSAAEVALSSLSHRGPSHSLAAKILVSLLFQFCFLFFLCRCLCFSLFFLFVLLNYIIALVLFYFQRVSHYSWVVLTRQMYLSYVSFHLGFIYAILIWVDFDLLLFYWFNEGDDALDDDCHWI